MMDDFVKLIGQLGFPIFTAIYLMTRMESQMKETNKLLSGLQILLEKMGGKEQ